MAAGLNIAQLVHLEHHDDDGGDDTAATSDFPMPAVQEEPAPAGAGAGKAPPVPRVVSQGALRMRDAAAAAGGGLAGFAAAPTPHASRVAARRAARGAYSWSPDGKPSRALSLVRLQAEANRNLTGVEARDQGSVSGTVISTYIKAGGGWLVVALIVFLMALEQGTRVFTDTWLGFWASNLFHRDLWFYLGVYAACGVGYSIVVYFRCAVRGSGKGRRIEGGELAIGVGVWGGLGYSIIVYFTGGQAALIQGDACKPAGWASSLHSHTRETPVNPRGGGAHQHPGSCSTRRAPTAGFMPRASGHPLTVANSPFSTPPGRCGSCTRPSTRRCRSTTSCSRTCCACPRPFSTPTPRAAS